MLKRDEIIWQNEVLEMAGQAGFYEWWNSNEPITKDELQTHLKTFAKLIEERTAAKEREACAKVCELESGDGPDNGCCPTFWNEAQEACAAAIRARGNKE